jgi:hypothetical protein
VCWCGTIGRKSDRRIAGPQQTNGSQCREASDSETDDGYRESSSRPFDTDTRRGRAWVNQQATWRRVREGGEDRRAAGHLPITDEVEVPEWADPMVERHDGKDNSSEDDDASDAHRDSLSSVHNLRLLGAVRLAFLDERQVLRSALGIAACLRWPSSDV